MKVKKGKNDINKAVRNIMKYSEQQQKWQDRLKYTGSSLFQRASEILKTNEEELTELLNEANLSHMSYGFIFEDFATALWDNESESFLAEYLKKRGWQESSLGRSYLKAVNESTMNLWEVTNVKPMFYVDVKLYGSNEKQIRVYEKAGTENMKKWDCLGGRVIQHAGKTRFTGAFLPLSQDEAMHVNNVILKAKKETENLINENLITDTIFITWLTGVYSLITRPMPELKNRDGEKFEIIKLRFPIQKNQKTLVEENLDKIYEFDRYADDLFWNWLSPIDKQTSSTELKPSTEQETISLNTTFIKHVDGVLGAVESSHHVLGTISLSNDFVEMEVNSTSRAEKGKSILALALKGLVCEPLTIHENLQNLLEKNQSSKKNDEIGFSNTEEERKVKLMFIEKYYRETLDEPLTVFNNKTPRECTNNPNTRAKVIKWLKELENSDAKNLQSGYDFTIMWEELGISTKEGTEV